MDELPLLYQQSPGLQQINLEFSEIESLDPILPLLVQFSDLRELLLFGNRLETLPADMSKLQNLEKLDISNNLIENIEGILTSLASIPSLIELHITLTNENDEELLIKSLKNLSNLNGSPIDRSKCEASSPESSPVFNPKKTYEEAEIAFTQSEFTPPIDYKEHDRYRDELDEDLCSSTKKLHADSPVLLKETESMDISGYESDEEEIKKTMVACETSGYFCEQSALSHEYLIKVAGLYDQIRALWQLEDTSMDRKLAEDFEEQIKGIMREVSGIINSGQSELIITAYSVKARSKLAGLCKAGISALLKKKYGKIGEFLQEIDGVVESLFTEIVDAVVEIQPKQKSEKTLSGTKREPHAIDSSRDLDQCAVERELKQIMQDKERMLKQFQEDRQEMLEEIESLREENKKYLDTIIRHSKSYANSAEHRKKSFGEQVVANKSVEEEKNYSVSTNKTSGKLLSLRQLKEVIEEIYQSKGKYDERCADGKMPRETMEQHMYNYLNNKYGLKNLILEWAASILTSVKKLSTKDNDVAVFGKIIRNECDEEFRFVQIQVKETVAELLKMHLKNKYPLKNNTDLMEMINEKTNGYLYEEEWTEIVKYMYNEEDSSTLIDELAVVIRKKKHLKTASVSKGKISREEAIALREKEKTMKTRISYADFLKVMLDFQLKGHEKFLAKFIQVFRKVDRDADGIINEHEFTELVLIMDLGFSEADITRLLQIIDPYDNQQITFSEGVGLFSTELIPVEGVAVMKKLSLEE